MNDDSIGTGTGLRDDAWAEESEQSLPTFRGEVSSPRGFDFLSGLLLREAGMLLDWVIDAEFETFFSQCATMTVGKDRRAVVRNGYQPTRELKTNLGPVPIRLPKLRCRGDARIVFRSRLVRPYVRRTRAPIREAPAQFLRGLGSGNLHAALAAIMGPEVVALPPSVMHRLIHRWEHEHKPWLSGPLAQVRWSLLWMDCVPCAAGPTDCTGSVLVAVGVGGEAPGRMLALSHGVPDTTASWTELLRGLRDRGLGRPPRWGSGANVAGGLGDALACVFPETSRRTA